MKGYEKWRKEHLNKITLEDVTTSTAYEKGFIDGFNCGKEKIIEFLCLLPINKFKFLSPLIKAIGTGDYYEEEKENELPKN